MDIIRMSFFGNSNIGVYGFTNNKIIILPPGIGRDDLREVSETLKVDIVEARIAGTILNGVFINGNDNGIVLPHIVFEEELGLIKEKAREHGLNIEVVRSKHTALGNLLLCNNKGCITSPLLEKEVRDKISDTLGVEVVEKDLMKLTIPGSLGVVNDLGGVVHPGFVDDDFKTLLDVLKIKAEKATVNAGVPYIRSGVLANNKGIVVGGNTTGPEIIRIKRGLGGELE
ncbi:translation initiation factor IF-6 [Thermosphaera aggregans]|uniref:Translation initiation factor 6 n=1 Tax=Thermosphaera aggregans (strain DSM 11486 / M11TL) TaxID=633148 RepID=D5U255_THEAM|nr:translation initiation factor IF-6 [Thermosphaera aggregans]ADG91205.1 translation initiation factor 6 (aeIF-6) [Thermosphaera aggregans DSM 11486]